MLRNKIDWKYINGTKEKVATMVATVFGAGFFPIAPGTIGSFVALLPTYWINGFGLLAKLAFWSLILLIGTWSAAIVAKTQRKADHQSIVIDEVLGLGITAWLAGQNFRSLAVCFALFRFFDVVKIFPANMADKWSKEQKLGSWQSGFGTMADDIIAALQALIAFLLLKQMGIVL